MIGRKFLPLFLLIILLALATSPLLAQDALTQNEQATDADGNTLSVSFPAGWKASTDSQGILLASNADALDELTRTGLVTKAGDIGIIVSLPNFMDNLSLPHDATANEAVSKYLEAAKLTGSKVKASSDFSVPAATAVVSPPNQPFKAVIGALQFPAGTIIIGVVPDTALDATTMAILQSVTLQASRNVPAPTPNNTSGLSQSSQLTDSTGLVLTVSYPDGWVANVTSQGIMLASSADALKELQTGNITTPGAVGMSISGPDELDRVHVSRDLSAEDALKGYIEGNSATGTVETSTDFNVPAAVSHLGISQDKNVLALVGALTFPDGIALFAVLPDSAVDAEVMSILNSITLEAPADTLNVPADTSVSLTTTEFPVPEPLDPLTFSLGLPDGWVSEYSENGALIYIGNSDAALRKASAPNVTFEPGEIALSIALPRAVTKLGIHPDVSPADGIGEFQVRTQSQGRAFTDDTFSVPAAHAHLTGGNLPEDGGDVFMLKFEKGLVFAVIQPSGILDGTTMAILQSIQLTDQSAPQATKVPATQESAGKLVTLPITQPNGAFDLSFELPDGWVEKVSSSSTSINIGNSAAAMDKVANGQEALTNGEVGLTIGVPALLVQMGVTFNATPQDAVSNFINITKSKGDVTEDDSFGVPAAHATITGDAVPGGGAELYALAFDGGTILIALQPMGASDDTVIGLINSIRFEPSTSAPSTPIPEATAIPAPTATPVTTAKELRQWASSASGTSQYGTDEWSFAQMTGEPDTPACGDNGTAWASEDSTGRAVIQVRFDQPVIASQINIYQSFNPGAIVEVDLGSAADPNKVLPLPHSADPPGNTECPGVFSIDVSGVNAPVNFIVIYIDQSLTGDWNEIDAVELVGTPAS